MVVKLIDEKKFGLKLALEAGAIIKENFSSGIALGMEKSMKADKTLITKTDTDINDLVIRSVKREFPEHKILAEEKSDLTSKSNYVWVCDPLDGTSVFTYGVPTSAFSLALVLHGTPVIGIVYDPFADRMFSAEIRRGAFLNDKRIKVSDINVLERSPLGIAYWRSAKFDINPLYNKLYNAGANVLQLGSIAYMGSLVANGSFVASIHPADMPYDSAALKVIVEEANGKVTDLFGNEQRYDGPIKGCIMSNRVLHNELVGLLKA